MRIVLSNAQPFVVARVWLDDGQTQNDIAASTGLTLGTSTAWLNPQRVGTWRLNVRATDANGCSDQTGLIRTVVVSQ